jgi:hypothetical protein
MFKHLTQRSRPIEAGQFVGRSDQPAATRQVAAAIEGGRVDAIEKLPGPPLIGRCGLVAFEVRLDQTQALEVQQLAHQPVQGLAGHPLEYVAKDHVARVGVAEVRAGLRQRAPIVMQNATCSAWAQTRVGSLCTASPKPSRSSL